VLLSRPASGSLRGSTSKGAKGNQHMNNVCSVWTANRQPCEDAIPSGVPSKQWILGGLGGRASVVSDQARLRPFDVCPVFLGGRQVVRQRSRAEQHLCAYAQ